MPDKCECKWNMLEARAEKMLDEARSQNLMVAGFVECYTQAIVAGLRGLVLHDTPRIEQVTGG